jgi:hypothetical protein
MKQRWKKAITTAGLAIAFAAAAIAQTERRVTFVTNSYELRVQQFSSGALAGGTRYVSFGGEAKAANNKTAADLKAFAFTVFYTLDPSGSVTISDGTFLVQTTNKDRSPIIFGGDIQPGGSFELREDGRIAAGQRISLPLVGSEGSEITGLITAVADKSSQPKLAGTLVLTYPVVQ